MAHTVKAGSSKSSHLSRLTTCSSQEVDGLLEEFWAAWGMDFMKAEDTGSNVSEGDSNINLIDMSIRKKNKTSKFALFYPGMTVFLSHH